MRAIKIKKESGEIIGVLGLLSSGLTDKNGIEIFEDTDVRIYHKGNYVTCKVVFVNGIFCLKWPDGYINNYQLNPSSLEVII